MPHKISFRVSHVSGQDSTYKASELNFHSPLTKGWQSSRFCLYPQDIVIQLTTRTRLRKIQLLSHQYLVATKIEFYVGDVPDGSAINLQNARYTRLGYVSLSDNDRTSFKARELKSVHVDAVGCFLKLVVHKNHINQLNLYNQVGIVAINVIGDEVSRLVRIDSMNYFEVEDTSNDTNKRHFQRSEYISPLDDLAFDMYQDPEIAHNIRQLEQIKLDSVEAEKYEFAKTVKQAITNLQKVGEKLGKMEVEKRQAVENEDYDTAQVKKQEMDALRARIYADVKLNELVNGVKESSQPTQRAKQRTPTPRLETPPPTARDAPTVRTPSPDSTPVPLRRDSTPVNNEDRPLPTSKRAAVEESDAVVTTENSDMDGDAAQMSEKDMREAGPSIDVFGLPLVSKAYSKTYSSREQGIVDMQEHLQGITSKEEARTAMRAAVFLIRRAIDDKVFAVFKAALSTLKFILTDFLSQVRIPRADVLYMVEKVLPNLLHKCGDTAVRNRDLAKDYIIEMSKFPDVQATRVVEQECVHLFKLNTPVRVAVSRVEIVEILHKEHGLTDSGFSVTNLMPFCIHCLQHTAGGVREGAERIIKALYSDVGSPVKEYLPSDDDKTRKNMLYRNLFEHFDQVDGKPTKKDMQKQKADARAKKQAELDALQNQLQDLKDMAAGKMPIKEDLIEEVNKPQKKGAAKVKANKLPEKNLKSKELNDDSISILNIDRTCIFCNERDDSFTDEGLDLHYWKDCPMLKRCGHCKQVVEVAGLTDHLLTECDAKASFSRCPRCTEAVPKPEYDQHISEKACTAAKSSMNHCPLCHQNFPTGDDIWKDHLMGKNKCKQNTRNLISQNKPTTGKVLGDPKTKAKSRLPVGRGKAPIKK